MIGSTSFENTGVDENSIDFNRVSRLRYAVFQGCKFTRVYLPATVDIKNSGHTFSANNELLKIEFGEGFSVIPLMVQSCGKLITLIYPSTTEEMGGGMLHRCTKVQHLIVKSVVPPVITGQLSLGYDMPTSYSIYVPDESVEAYKSADIWKNYSSKIKPMSQKPENV